MTAPPTLSGEAPNIPGCVQSADTPSVEYDEDPDNVPLDGRVIVSPPAFETTDYIQPGDRFVCVVTVRNRLDRRATLELRPTGILGSHSSRTSAEFVAPDDTDAGATAVGWLEPVVDHVTLDPRGVARVPVILTVPDEPPVGSAYGGVDVVAQSTTAGPGDTKLGIEKHVVASFLLAVGGEGRPNLKLRDVHAPKLRWKRDPWTLRAKLDNTGTLHATPRGRVRIRSLFGNVVNELKVADLPLLPGGRTRIERTWDDVPWFGIYRWDLRVASSDGDAPADVERADGWFVALPPWWVLALAAAIILFAIYNRAARRDSERATYDDDQDSWSDADRSEDG